MPRGRSKRSSPAGRLTIKTVTHWLEPQLAGDGEQTELSPSQVQEAREQKTE